jgi:hypothetical protein
VEKQNSVTVTSAMLGVFQNDARTRSEFLGLIRRPGGQIEAGPSESAPPSGDGTF